jgi:hypothetical protein
MKARAVDPIQSGTIPLRLPYEEPSVEALGELSGIVGYTVSVRAN